MTEECRGWSATHNRMPPDGPVLRVTGECTMPTPGYRCSLKKAEPQGTNPRDLLLELVIDKPTGFQNPAIAPCPIEYELNTSEGFDTVSIVDVEVGIPVQTIN